jgi:tetratricopeptide (TPR) repeat protein
MVKMLTYLVEQELAGQGGAIKAYSIAIDALGHDSSFDPQSDTSIRVGMRRLRDALSVYYLEHGAEDPLVITIPKGRYRPVFTAAGVDPAKQLSSMMGAAQAWLTPTRLFLSASLFVAAFAALVFAVAGLLNSQQSRTLQADAGAAQPPIVEIMPFLPTGDESLDIQLEGLRNIFGADIAKFKMVRVRVVPKNAAARTYSEEQQAEYRIRGILESLHAEPHIALSVERADDGTLLWSNDFVYPTTEEDYSQLLAGSLRNMVTQIIGQNGVVTADMRQRLLAQEIRTGDSLGGEGFRCVLMFHAYDLSKEPEEETAARECLRTLVEGGNQDGLVWSAWSMMVFLDWSKKNDPALLEQSLAAARKAVRLDPSYANAHEYLGSILMAKGERAEARAAYERAIELNPSKPDLYVLLGWEKALGGDWETGIPMLKQGVDMAAVPAGWMRIPLSMNAFRNGDYQTALSEAEAIIQTGDNRGVILAVAAALAMDDMATAERYRAAFDGNDNNHPEDPMLEIRSVFNNQPVLARYEEVLSVWYGKRA